MRHGFPQARPGQVIGLLGGSFDPPHAGHAHISREALKRFRLDRVWWLVSPGNPLKTRAPAPIADRVRAAQAIAQDPRITVTDIEERLGTRYTAETLRALRRAWPGVRFVWLMGADNLWHFHRWKDWREIMETVPVGVLVRPGSRTPARNARAALTYASCRLPVHRAALLGRARAPAWVMINAPMVEMSSTALRHLAAERMQASAAAPPPAGRNESPNPPKGE